MVTTLAWLALTLLVILGWLRLRARMSRGRARPHPELDDEGVRRILREGRLVTEEEEEPLDLEEIREEERRFWDESWDEPEEW